MTLPIITDQSPNGGITAPAFLDAPSDFFVVNTLVPVAEGALGTGAVGPSAGTSATANYKLFMQTATNFVNCYYLSVGTTVGVDLTNATNKVTYGTFGTAVVGTYNTVYTIKFMTQEQNFLTVANFGSALDGLSLPPLGFGGTAAGTWNIPQTGSLGTTTVAISTYAVSGTATNNTVITLFDYV